MAGKKKKKESSKAMRERIILKAILEGKNKREAWLLAGYSESYINKMYGKGMENMSIQPAIRTLMAEKGLTDAYLVEKLKEGLNAYKPISCLVIANNGEGMKDANSMTKDFVDVPDFLVIHKNLQLAFKLADLYPVEKKIIELPTQSKVHLTPVAEYDK